MLFGPFIKCTSILDLLNSIYEEVQSIPNWKMVHIMRIQFHIIWSRMQYITITMLHNSIHHSDIPNTNLSMWIITESACRKKRNGLNISKVLKMKLITVRIVLLSLHTQMSHIKVYSVYRCCVVAIWSSASAGWWDWWWIHNNLYRQVGWDFISVM